MLDWAALCERYLEARSALVWYWWESSLLAAIQKVAGATATTTAEKPEPTWQERAGVDARAALEPEAERAALARPGALPRRAAR